MHVFYIDADACPVKGEVYKVARRVKWRVVVVANQYLDVPAADWVERVIVGEGADVADDWIAERVGPGDVVITADIPLAARALEAGAAAVGPKGREFTADSIGGALASRALSQGLREMGMATGGPKPLTAKDRSRFLNTLDRLVQAARRAHPLNE